MQLAVQHGPEWIYHRLDLALVLVDREKYSEARVQLDTIAHMRPREPMDATYQREARLLLQRLSEGDHQ